MKNATRRALVLLALTLIAPTALGQEGDAVEARRASDEALSDALETLGDGDVGGGLALLRESVARDPRNPAARTELGAFLLRSGALAEAGAQFRAALEAGAGARARLSLAETLIQQGRAGAALPVLAEAEAEAEDADGKAEVLSARGAALLALGRVDEAEESFASALAQAPQDRWARLGAARVAFARGDFQDAVARIDALLAADPTFAPAWTLKGRIALGQYAEGGLAAVAYFDRAVAEAPEDVGLLAARAQALLALGRLEQAREDVLRVVEIAPQSPHADYLVAAQDYALGYVDSASDGLARLSEAYPDYAPARLLGAYVAYQRGELDRAEAILRAHLEAQPGDAAIRRALAAVRLRNEDPAGALEALGEGGGSATPRDRRLAASALVRSGAFGAAAELFQTIRREASPRSGRVEGAAVTALGAPFDLTIPRPPRAVPLDFAHSVLGVLDRLARRDLAEARALLEALIAETPENPTLFELKGELELAEGAPEAARASFQRALEIDPEFVAAHDNLDAMDRIDDPEAAVPAATLERLEPLQRGNAASDPLALRLAQAYLAADRADDAVTLLQGRFAEAAGDAEIGRAYVRMLLRADRQSEAVKAIKRLSVNADQDLDTLVFAANALLDAGAPQDALSASRRVTALLPKDPRAFLLVARAQLALDDVEGARTTLSRAFASQPRSVALAGALIDLAAAQGDREGGLEIGRKLSRYHPRTSARMRAALLTRLGDPEAAVAVLEEAMAKTPTGGIAVDLFVARLGLGLEDAAYEGLDAWLAAAPEDAAALSAKGAALIAAARLDEAAEVLALAVRQAPTDPVALNNYAHVLAEGQRPGALGVAERAYRLAPGDPRVAATYGRLLVAGGRIMRGAALLRLASEHAPGDGDILFHFAVALERSGAREAAIDTLEAALGQSEDFPKRAAAETFLRELK